MKKFTSKVQRLSQRAAEIRQAIESVPPKIAEVREAVVGAAVQVQKLRTDLISSVATLRAETDTQLVETLREIDAGVELLNEAGCRLDGVDLDLGPARRLVVYLAREEDVGAARVRALINANSQRPVVAALLAAILKAGDLAEKVELSHLSYTKLRVEIGLVPSVRMGWRGEEPALPEALPAPPEAASGAASRAEVCHPLDDKPDCHPMDDKGGRSTFFERQEVAAMGVAAGERADSAGALLRDPKAGPKPELAAAIAGAGEDAVVASRGAEANPALRGDWRSGALDRFKKMPDLSTRRGR